MKFFGWCVSVCLCAYMCVLIDLICLCLPGSIPVRMLEFLDFKPSLSTMAGCWVFLLWSLCLSVCRSVCLSVCFFCLSVPVTLLVHSLHRTIFMYMVYLYIQDYYSNPPWAAQNTVGFSNAVAQSFAEQYAVFFPIVSPIPIVRPGKQTHLLYISTTASQRLSLQAPRPQILMYNTRTSGNFHLTTHSR